MLIKLFELFFCESTLDRKASLLKLAWLSDIFIEFTYPFTDKSLWDLSMTEGFVFCKSLACSAAFSIWLINGVLIYCKVVSYLFSMYLFLAGRAGLSPRVKSSSD